jgi:hypothetical protein
MCSILRSFHDNFNMVLDIISIELSYIMRGENDLPYCGPTIPLWGIIDGETRDWQWYDHLHEKSQRGNGLIDRFSSSWEQFTHYRNVHHQCRWRAANLYQCSALIWLLLVMVLLRTKSCHCTGLSVLRSHLWFVFPIRLMRLITVHYVCHFL